MDLLGHSRFGATFRAAGAGKRKRAGNQNRQNSLMILWEI
jgi:hypothetical protein